jgi:beta-phosphoglucomutase-like phosphatase (HAD superfamily)
MTKEKYKGVIFDFNGTLFFDSDKHEKAWKRFSTDVRGYAFTDEEIARMVHGRTNRAILEYLLEREIPDDVLQYFVVKKEAYYKQSCLLDKKNMKLVDGATDLFEFLIKSRIPMTIATASDATNLEFFNEQFALERWFAMEKIVFDDFKIKGKPAPDMFLTATEKLGVKPVECIIFEDSESGVQAAKAAGIGKIVIMDPKGENSKFVAYQEVSLVIPDFTAFDPSRYF